MAESRPPIIAVVGHIDHGKSKLQHALRESDTELDEAGNITQHIGAYELHALYEGQKRRATVIDTPGHAAFSHVREHGIEIADLALLVVSSEEGWKEQTAEAYRLLKQHTLPFIVVFTKIDTERSDLERAKHSVLQEGVLLEGLGGDIPWSAVSSVTGEGIAQLVELLFLTSDVYETTVSENDGAIGILIEADIDPKTGIAGTLIVLRDTLSLGGYLQVGGAVAPLRSMKDDRGAPIDQATPCAPVRIIGFDRVPPIGEKVWVHASKKEAVDAARAQSSARAPTYATGGAERTIPLILRSDTASGLLSLEHAVTQAGIEGVTFVVVKKEIGDISEEDVRRIATESDGHIVGFHTKAHPQAVQLAERSGVHLHLFPTIYELIEWATRLSEGKKESFELSNPTGKATVIRLFEQNSTQGRYILGAQLLDGVVSVGQDIVIQKQGSSARFTIESIEQRNKQCDEVRGEKTQFALQLKGEGEPALNDTLLALPILPADV